MILIPSHGNESTRSHRGRQGDRQLCRSQSWWERKLVTHLLSTICYQISQILCAENWQSFLCCWMTWIHTAHRHTATLVITWSLCQLLPSALWEPASQSTPWPLWPCVIPCEWLNAIVLCQPFLPHVKSPSYFWAPPQASPPIVIVVFNNVLEARFF